MVTRSDQPNATDKQFLMERVFDAPRELVFKAFTDPEMLMNWWGPRTFTTPVAKIDLRVGGRFHFCMRGEDGKDYWGIWTYKEIVPNEKLVCSDSFSNAAGEVVSPAEYGLTDWPEETTAILVFEDAGDGKTKLTISGDVTAAQAESSGASEGWSSQLDKLVELLAQA